MHYDYFSWEHRWATHTKLESKRKRKSKRDRMKMRRKRKSRRRRWGRRKRRKRRKRKRFVCQFVSDAHVTKCGVTLPDGCPSHAEQSFTVVPKGLCGILVSPAPNFCSSAKLLLQCQTSAPAPNLFFD